MSLGILILALLIGVVLGLIGSGGSILTVPVLVYGLGVEPVTATAYSLFIVGLTALVGAVPYARRGDIDVRALYSFALPSILAVYATRLWLLPALPDVWFATDSITITKGKGILLIFAILMVAAAVAMLREDRPAGVSTARRPGLMAVEGVLVGALTGLVGAGGGFLIIPALVLLAGLPMKAAVGTSLALIAAKSLIGFTGDLQAGLTPDWSLLLGFTATAVAGILIGTRFTEHIPAAHLKKGFGVFLILVAVLMLLSEIGN